MHPDERDDLRKMDALDAFASQGAAMRWALRYRFARRWLAIFTIGGLAAGLVLGVVGTCATMYVTDRLTAASPIAAEPSAAEGTASPSGDFDPVGPDRNCSDFPRWELAQAFYLRAGGPSADPHRLDRDRNGIACESLPGAPP